MKEEPRRAIERLLGEWREMAADLDALVAMSEKQLKTASEPAAPIARRNSMSGTVAASVSVKIGAVMDSTIGSVFGGVNSKLRQVGSVMKDLNRAVSRDEGSSMLRPPRFGQSVETLSDASRSSKLQSIPQRPHLKS